MHAKEVAGPLVIEVKEQRNVGLVLFVKKFDLLGCRYKRRGTCEAGMKKTLEKGMNSWFKEAHLYRLTEHSLMFDTSTASF